MISGSATSPIFYTFTCEESFFWVKFWLGQIWFFCGLASLITVTQSANKSTCLFATVYITAVFLTMPCALHATYGMAEGQAWGFKLSPWLIGEHFYGIGAVLYGTKTPERFFKGKCDFIGSGHNWFHLGCAIGAAIHFWASLKSFHERQLFECPEIG